MKFAEPTEGQKLSFLLEKAASREAKLWRSYVPKKPANQDTDISPAQRDEAVRWLTDVHRSLKLYPETLCLAISILDRFLSTIKARPKYLRCIAITCFFLAAKTSEEDEHIPALRELISSSACGCTPSEVLRMERIILDKLNWDLHAATPLDFLHIFHAMVFSCKAMSSSVLLGLNRSQHLALLTQELLHCLSHNALLQERGSMLALALVTLQLEKLCPDWLALAADLLRKVQIDSSKLIGCRELVARCLSTHTASLPPNTVYVCHPLQTPYDPSVTFHPVLPPLPLRRKPSAKRKVEQMDVDEYFDGIKRLYNEEELGGGGGVTSGYQSIEGESTPCPALQPVAVSEQCAWR
ncbi:cyclin-I [Neoarius graeffei]|uniref:cyclin-I n=1 Tax=Neoarius graeffei TaxID=443677 RepID=UPI00298D4FAC|nr:cyclin-I [Neoarius graeffei]